MLVYHVPKIFTENHRMKIFTGQGVERTNYAPFTTRSATNTMPALQIMKCSQVPIPNKMLPVGQKQSLTKTPTSKQTADL